MLFRSMKLFFSAWVIMLTLGLTDQETYRLSSMQAKNILQMRLQSLTGLEQEKIHAEYKELVDTIIDLTDILAKPERVTAIIADSLETVAAEFGDERKTQIVANAENVKTKDLIPLREMVVTLTDTGYIKSQASIEYSAQKRGGQGKRARSEERRVGKECRSRWSPYH